MTLVLAVLFSLITSLAHAATYYVDPTGNNTTGTGAIDNPWLTIQKCVDSVSASGGDTCSINDGDYAPVLLHTSTPAGTSSAPHILKATNKNGARIAFTTQGYGVYFLKRWWILDGFDISGGTDSSNNHAVKVESNAGDIVIRNNTIHDIANNVCSNVSNGMDGVTIIAGATNVTVANNIFHTIGRRQNGESGCGTQINANDHGVYVEGGSGHVIVHNVFYQMKGYSVHVYKLNGSGSNITVNFNTFSDPVASNATSHVIFQWSQGLTNATLDGNISDGTFLLTCNTGGTFTNVVVRRNITTTANVQAAACPGTITFSNNTTSSSSINFTDSSSRDYSLLSTSAAINAATGITAASGYPCNGTCDMGAFETLGGYSSATVNENSLDVTLAMSTNVPVLPASGMTGWTATVNGVARTVTSAARLSPSDTTVRLTLSGSACVGGQTWLVSYSGGNVTDSALNGGTNNQKLFAFTDQAVTNNCGSAPPSDPGTKYIYYKFEDGSIGLCCNDETANGEDGVPTNTPTYTATGGHNGSGGVTTTDASSQYIAVPYGSGVNPSTQSLTIAVGVLVGSGSESLARTYLGSTNGTSQRFYVSTLDGQWRIGIQGSSDGTASNLTVTAGWNRLCLNVDSGSDTATLYVNGVAGTTGAAKTYTSYTLASDLRVGSPFASNSPGTTYDEFMVYQSVVSCADDFQIWEQTSPAPTGTFDQKTHKFQKLRKAANGDPIDLATAGSHISVVPGGAFELIVQVDCTGADCSAFSPRLQYSRNSGSYQAISDSCAGADTICFYGDTGDADVVSAAVTCCLTGALTTNDGITVFTAAAIPNVDLDEDASVVQRYVLKFGTATAGDTYDFRVYTDTGNALDAYTATPRATIIPLSMGVGF